MALKAKMRVLYLYDTDINKQWDRTSPLKISHIKLNLLESFETADVVIYRPEKGNVQLVKSRY